MVAEVEQEIEALLGTGAVEELDLEAVETALRRRALRVAARLLEERLNADHCDQSGTTRPCGCGQKARYVGRRAKRFQSVLRGLNLERAYYHCPACGEGCCPASGSRTPSLPRLSSSCSAETRSPGTLRLLIAQQDPGGEQKIVAIECVSLRMQTESA